MVVSNSHSRLLSTVYNEETETPGWERTYPEAHQQVSCKTPKPQAFSFPVHLLCCSDWLLSNDCFRKGKQITYEVIFRLFLSCTAKVPFYLLMSLSCKTPKPQAFSFPVHLLCCSDWLLSNDCFRKGKQITYEVIFRLFLSCTTKVPFYLLMSLLKTLKTSSDTFISLLNWQCAVIQNSSDSSNFQHHLTQELYCTETSLSYNSHKY